MRECYESVCFRCLKKGEIHSEHIKPLTLYPEQCLNFNNLQFLCRECNLARSNSNSCRYKKILKENPSIPSNEAVALYAKKWDRFFPIKEKKARAEIVKRIKKPREERISIGSVPIISKSFVPKTIIRKNKAGG